MSERNVKLFYNEMCKNEKLQNEIKEVLGGANTESDKQALLNDIAKKYHFDFTPKEAKKFAENLSKNKLSLDDLSDVSGGFGRKTAIVAFTALTALGSLGSAGAIISHAAIAGGNNPNQEEEKVEEERVEVENDLDQRQEDTQNQDKEEINQNQKEIDNNENTEGAYNENAIDNNDETKQKEKEEEENKRKKAEEKKQKEEVDESKVCNMYDLLSEETKNLIKKDGEYKTHVDGFNEIKNKLENDTELHYKIVEEDNEAAIIEQKINSYERILEDIDEENVKNKLESQKNTLIKGMIDSNKSIDYNSLNKSLQTKTKIMELCISNTVKQMDDMIKYFDKIKKKIDEIENNFSSKIINEDNKNIFEELVCKTKNLKPLYRMTRDGESAKSIQNKIKNHSHIVVLVKTDENKIFGGYTSCELEYTAARSNFSKRDDKSFLFSIDLNKKFNIKKTQIAIEDQIRYGISFGNHDLMLFDNLKYSETTGYFPTFFSRFGSESSLYENNEIKNREFCGGTYKKTVIGVEGYEFKPIEIEIFELDDHEIFEKESKMKVQELFKNANNDTASKDSQGSQVKKLAENIKFLYQAYKDNGKDYGDDIKKLFKDSNYIWYYHKIDNSLTNPVNIFTNGSYYLLKNKINNDVYYLTQPYPLYGDRKVVYYNSSTATTDLNNSDLEKELHQRRLFRNALEEILNDKDSRVDGTMIDWATGLKNTIMPDKPDFIKDTDFYRP